jgi:DNA-binding transcriptional regulator YdaS (Cro superfamily)
MEVNPLKRAIGIVGTQTALATKIGRRQSTIHEWVKRGWPSPDACHAIEEATDGKVTAAELLEPAMRRA